MIGFILQTVYLSFITPTNMADTAVISIMSNSDLTPSATAAAVDGVVSTASSIAKLLDTIGTGIKTTCNTHDDWTHAAVKVASRHADDHRSLHDQLEKVEGRLAKLESLLVPDAGGADVVTTSTGLF